MKKTIGIIGGMGPMATCDLMKKIFEVSDADCDQNYVHVCVDCNTNIPDLSLIHISEPTRRS